MGKKGILTSVIQYVFFHNLELSKKFRCNNLNWSIIINILDEIIRLPIFYALMIKNLDGLKDKVLNIGNLFSPKIFLPFKWKSDEKIQPKGVTADYRGYAKAH